MIRLVNLGNNVMFTCYTDIRLDSSLKNYWYSEMRIDYELPPDTEWAKSDETGKPFPLVKIGEQRVPCSPYILGRGNKELGEKLCKGYLREREVKEKLKTASLKPKTRKELDAELKKIQKDRKTFENQIDKEEAEAKAAAEKAKAEKEAKEAAEKKAVEDAHEAAKTTFAYMQKAGVDEETIVNALLGKDEDAGIAVKNIEGFLGDNELANKVSSDTVVSGKRVGGGNKTNAMFKSSIQEESHEKHLPEFKEMFGIETMEEYKQMAKAFGEKKNDGKLIIGAVNEEGNELKFNTVTKEIGVFNAKGNIVTYYILNSQLNPPHFKGNWKEKANKKVVNKFNTFILEGGIKKTYY